MTKKSITIAGRKIGTEHPPYIIAELSGNHNGDLNRAFAIMTAARDAGADAVKLQTYTADTITLDHDGPEFKIDSGLWQGQTLHELYQEAATPWEWHEALFDKGRELGITVFSSPFDATACDLLQSLSAPAYKIASFEVVDLPLIEKAAAAGKPVIISTGMAVEEEIRDALDAARHGGAEDVILLHCVSSYPTDPKDSNLRSLPDLARSFGVITGLSDHTLGNITAITAVALGAAVIEKHVTLRRADGGPDAAFSLEPVELEALVKDTKIAWQALGNVHYGPSETEKDSLKFRRSLYAVRDIAKGQIVAEADVRSIRPAKGLALKHLPDVVGRFAAQEIKRGTPLSWDLLD
jgi:pseudaminic acid synthase